MPTDIANHATMHPNRVTPTPMSCPMTRARDGGRATPVCGAVPVSGPEWFPSLGPPVRAAHTHSSPGFDAAIQGAVNGQRELKAIRAAASAKGWKSTDTVPSNGL